MSELPDLDEDVSFVVDNGASVGPIAMQAIVDSIAAGERADSSLVWWQGATDWIRFDSHPALKALVVPEQSDEASDIRWGVPSQPAEPEPMHAAAHAAAVVDPVVEHPSNEVTMTSTESVEAFNPQPTAGGLSPFAPTTFSESTPVADASADTAQDQSQIGAHVAADDSPAEPVATVLEAESSSGGSEFSFNLPTRESSDTEEPVPTAPLTGLFSSGSRVESADNGSSQVPTPDALDAILAARQSLESVGARIEALSSATRRSLSPEELQDLEAVASLPDGQWTDAVTDTPKAASVAAGGAVPETAIVATADATASAEAAQERVAEEQTSVMTAGSWTPVAEPVDDAEAASEPKVAADIGRAQLTERFDEMVRKSVAHQRRIEWITRVDELLLSSCITAIADSGYSALDLNSRESDHRVLFDHNDDSRRVRLDLSPVHAIGEGFGRHVRFGLSWGQDVAEPERAFTVVRQQAIDGQIPPGVVTCEADMSTGSVSTNVELIFAADDFVKDDYSVDRASLDASIAATLHALEQRWHELFDQ